MESRVDRIDVHREDLSLDLDGDPDLDGIFALSVVFVFMCGRIYESWTLLWP